MRLLAMLTLLAVVMNLVRLLLADNDAYIWLNWNLFLALVPLALAYYMKESHYRSVLVVSGILWLGFLPNAPYIITDFIHLADVGPRSLLWYDAIMILAYSLVGVLSYLTSLRIVSLRANFSLWFPLMVSFLTGFGIYLGRYIRFNTWHLITQPGDILGTLGDIIIHPQTHEPVVTMTIAFAAFLFLLYYMSSPYILNEKSIS